MEHLLSSPDEIARLRTRMEELSGEPQRDEDVVAEVQQTLERTTDPLTPGEVGRMAALIDEWQAAVGQWLSDEILEAWLLRHASIVSSRFEDM